MHRAVKKAEGNLHKIRDAANQYERNAALAKAPDGDVPRGTLEAALGRAMHHTTIIARLRTANPRLHFEVSPVTKRIGVYYPDSTVPGGRKYLGMTIGQGVNPEFTPLLSRSDGTLESVQPGYRTVISRLIRGRFITETEALRLFGAVNSQKWQQSLA